MAAEGDRLPQASRVEPPHAAAVETDEERRGRFEGEGDDVGVRRLAADAGPGLPPSVERRTPSFHAPAQIVPEARSTRSRRTFRVSVPLPAEAHVFPPSAER